MLFLRRRGPRRSSGGPGQFADKSAPVP